MNFPLSTAHMMTAAMRAQGCAFHIGHHPSSWLTKSRLHPWTSPSGNVLADFLLRFAFKTGAEQAAGDVPRLLLLRRLASRRGLLAARGAAAHRELHHGGGWMGGWMDVGGARWRAVRALGLLLAAVSDSCWQVRAGRQDQRCLKQRKRAPEKGARGQGWASTLESS